MPDALTKGGIESCGGLPSAEIVENGDPDVIPQACDYIVHCHIANPNNGRVFPRDESEDSRYAAFFRALKSTGYDGRLSLQANTNDLEPDARADLPLMKRTYEKYR